MNKMTDPLSEMVGEDISPVSIEDRFAVQEAENIEVLLGRKGRVAGGHVEDKLLEVTKKAYDLIEKGRYKKAVRILTKATAINERLAGLATSSIYHNALATLAEASYDLKEFADAKETLDLLVSINDNLLRRPLDLNNPKFHILYAKVQEEAYKGADNQVIGADLDSAIRHLRRAEDLLDDTENKELLGITDEVESELRFDLVVHLGGCYRKKKDETGHYGFIDDAIAAYKQAFYIGQEDISSYGKLASDEIKRNVQVNEALQMLYGDKRAQLRNQVQVYRVIQPQAGYQEMGASMEGEQTATEEQAQQTNQEEEQQATGEQVQPTTQEGEQHYLEAGNYHFHRNNLEGNETPQESAQQLYDAGMNFARQYGRQNQVNAVNKFIEALRIDPHYAPAYNALVIVHSHIARELMDGRTK